MTPSLLATLRTLDPDDPALDAQLEAAIAAEVEHRVAARMRGAAALVLSQLAVRPHLLTAALHSGPPMVIRETMRMQRQAFTDQLTHAGQGWAAVTLRTLWGLHDAP